VASQVFVFPFSRLSISTGMPRALPGMSSSIF
jgi:hypothetical protein